MAEEVTVKVGDRLRLTYPASDAFDMHTHDVVVTATYEDGAFNVDEYPLDVPLVDHVVSTSDWTVFPSEVRNDTVRVEKRG